MARERAPGGRREARPERPHGEPDAALAFGRGLDLEDRGDFDGARREYERALRLDRSFRLAQNQLVTLPAAEMSLSAVAMAVQYRPVDCDP